MPSQVLGVVSAASLDGALGGMAAFANEIKPGIGGVISSPMVAVGLAQGMGAKSLMGIHWDKAVHLVAVHREGAPPAMVLVAEASDGKALQEGLGDKIIARLRGATAVIGEKASVDLVAPWVFGSLVAKPAPAELTATAFPVHIQAIYGEQIASGLAQMEAMLPPEQKQVAAMYKSMWATIAAESDAIFITAAANATDASLAFGLHAKANTTLAAFVAAQQPNDYALLRKLPGRTTTSFMVGSLALGPYAGSIMTYVNSASSGMAAWAPIVQAFLKSDAAQMAGAFTTLTNMSAVMDFGDAKLASAIGSELYAGLSKSPTSSANGLIISFSNVRQGTVGPAEVVSYDQKIDVDPASPQAAVLKANPMIAQLASSMSGAAVGRYFVTSIKPLGQPVTIGEGIAAVSATDGDARPFAPEIEAMLSKSRERKESFVVAYDIQVLLPIMLAATGNAGAALPAMGFAPVELGFGTRDGAVQFRMTVTSATVKSAVAAFAALGASAPAPL